MSADDVTRSVAALYNLFPFPPDPIIDEPPPGYNWRWSWEGAYGFCTGGQFPVLKSPRILDAGCGSGVSTEYLAHLNPEAEILAVDISPGALAVAQQRIAHSIGEAPRIQFAQCSLYDLSEVEGTFDLINCVGVLHHMAEPDRGLKALAEKLAPGGLLHLFLYAEIGRWEIRLMQEALQLLQPNSTDIQAGVNLGRAIFAALPPSNRLVQREKTRWQLENTRDECFADMYLHPHEIRYTIDSLFSLIDRSGLTFVGFSNPKTWQLERLLANNADLLNQAKSLPPRHQYRLLELLDTDIAHYEFFLCRPPLPQLDISQSELLLSAKPYRHPCINGWESTSLFNCDYEICQLTAPEFAFMQQCSEGLTVQQIIAANPDLSLSTLHALLQQRLVLLQLSASHSAD